MTTKAIRRFVLLIALPLALRASAIDWPEFMARQDPVWTRVPKEWYEAPFLGNGELGTLIRQSGRNEIRFDVGSTAVWDHRPEGGLFGRCRLPIGHFTLTTAGAVTGCTMRLDLWNAECRGTFLTANGSIAFTTRVDDVQSAILVDWQPSRGEDAAKIAWVAEESGCPRWYKVKSDPARAPKNYLPNPPAKVTKLPGGTFCCEQPMLAGGCYRTIWTETTGAVRSLAARVQYAPAGEAVDAGKPVSPGDVAGHRAARHSFYTNSFVSLPDPYWEGFYWMQMYKLQAATRGDKPMLDLCGPWLQPTPWPAIWWNLNVQLTYWPTYTGNRLDIAESLRRTLRNGTSNLIANVPAKYRDDSAAIARTSGPELIGAVKEPGGKSVEAGNLPWALHDLWMHYRMTMDDALLREELYPLLRRSINWYRHFLTAGADGRLHLATTYSPEFGDAPDCNYDLALLRWGCETLLWSSERLKIDDPLRPAWKDILAKLTDFPQDVEGMLIGAGVPLNISHRHFSHLLSVYPLYLVNKDQPGARALIEKSLKHWHSFKGGLQGYSFTGGASISAALGDGNKALEYLDGLKRYLQPNTMYRESGPVIETPLAAAQSIHDLLIQSWGDRIRVFPAVPDAWKDVCFGNLRAEGGFLVSASRKGGKTEWVRITSLAGEPCRIEADAGLRLAGGSIKQKQGVYVLTLKKGESALLYAGDQVPEARVEPVLPSALPHRFGLCE